MRRVPRPGDILLAAAVLLLILATANQLEAGADAHERRAADRAAIARFHLRRARVAHHARYDLVCATHGPRPSRICVRVRHEA